MKAVSRRSAAQRRATLIPMLWTVGWINLLAAALLIAMVLHLASGARS